MGCTYHSLSLSILETFLRRAYPATAMILTQEREGQHTASQSKTNECAQRVHGGFNGVSSRSHKTDPDHRLAHIFRVGGRA